MSKEIFSKIPALAEHGSKRVIVEDVRLQRAQKLHAIYITNVIPTLGFIAALILAYYRGIGAMEIYTLVIMYTLTVIGLEVGFHRLFTHKSFKTSYPVTAMLAIFGSACAQGPLIYWVANHRRHHRHSDKNGDPHSPNTSDNTLKGLWYAHIAWQYNDHAPNTAYFAKDLLKDKNIYNLNRFYFLWVIAGIVAPSLICFLIDGTIWGAIAGALWGGLARIFIVNQITFSINSFCHVFGKKDHHTNEESRNNLLLAIPTFGQAWHNNHHAFPYSATMNQKWWQIDLGGYFIQLLRLFGLAWDVKQAPRDRKKSL